MHHFAARCERVLCVDLQCTSTHRGTRVLQLPSEGGSTKSSVGRVRSRIHIIWKGGRKEGRKGREGREGLNLRERGLGTRVGTETFECNRRK